jgi:hypothetical protein
MMMLQFEDVFVSARVVQLHARLLGRQARLRRLLLGDEGSSRRRLGDAYTGKARFLKLTMK